MRPASVRADSVRAAARARALVLMGLAGAGLAGASACASIGAAFGVGAGHGAAATRSWVTVPIAPAPRAGATSEGALATVVAQLAARRLPPASTTLYVAPPTADDARGRAAAARFNAALTRALRRAGFALVEASGEASARPASGSAPSQAASVQRLRYLVTPLDAAVLVRVQLTVPARATEPAVTELACLYRADATGALVAVTPLTVREASS